MMSFSWKQYEGQVINNTFPLQRYLGGSSESAVFLTQLAGPQSSKAVLKLIPEGASVDLHSFPLAPRFETHASQFAAVVPGRPLPPGRHGPALRGHGTRRRKSFRDPPATGAHAVGSPRHARPGAGRPKQLAR